MKASDRSRYAARARLAKALGHPTRLWILDLLQQEQCVLDLTRTVELDQSTVSRHLAILEAANLITHRKQGTMNLYRAACDCVEGFFACFEPVPLAPVRPARSAAGARR
jgi:ArsR family transcriptional regulator